MRGIAIGLALVAVGAAVFLLGGHPAAAQQQQVVLNCEVELDWCEALKARFEAATGIKAAARGETTIGVAFLHDSVAQTVQGFPVKTVAPCEGTGFEVSTVAIVKGARNLENAKKWVDWSLSPDAQDVAIDVGKFQLPSNKAAKVHPQAPRPEQVKLLNYDLYKYASDETRSKMLERFEEIRKLPK